MNATRITYYTSTGLMSFAMAFSTYAYLTKPELKEAFQHLGFPDYFRVELAIAKLLAAIALWLPLRLAKEAAYIGLAISFISALIAHLAMNDTMGHTLYPVVVLAILVVSYVSHNHLQANKKNAFIHSNKNKRMKKILHIISSPQGEASVSKKLGNVILEKIKTKYPGSTVKERDLSAQPFPHLDRTQIGSWFTPADQRSPEQANAIKVSDEAIAELQEADIYIIGAPFYNFAIPSTLKAYLDHIARPGITFRYNENGQPEGFLKNKKVYVACASSGVYSEGEFQSFDFVSPYLKFLLGFLGITDLSFIRAEGLRLEGIKETAFEKGVESIVID